MTPPPDIPHVALERTTLFRQRRTVNLFFSTCRECHVLAGVALPTGVAGEADGTEVSRILGAVRMTEIEV